MIINSGHEVLRQTAFARLCQLLGGVILLLITGLQGELLGQSTSVVEWNYGTGVLGSANASVVHGAVSTSPVTIQASSVSGFSASLVGVTPSFYQSAGSWTSAETSMLTGRTSTAPVSGAKVIYSTFALKNPAVGDWSSMAVSLDYLRSASTAPSRVRAYLTWSEGGVWKTRYSGLVTLSSTTGVWQTALSLPLNTGSTAPASTALAGTTFLLELQFSTVSNSTNSISVDNVKFLVNSLSNSDFGDHIYGTLAASTASQVASSDIRVGTNPTDIEATDPSDANASADDLAGTDDEDLNMPSFLVGIASNLAIPVTVNTANISGSTARLNVFVDWNGDGDVLDAGETQVVQTVNAGGTFNFSLTPPAGTTPGTKYLRIRATEGSTAPNFAGASTLKGEVEDYAITVTNNDYGDWSGSGALSTSTTSVMNSNLRLGASVDAEASITPDAAATADGSDDDGVTMPTSIVQGRSVTIPISVFNNTGANAYLNAWIDFNNDGTFNDTLVSSGGERLEAARTIASSATASTQNITFTVPATASVGTLRGVRFRLTNQATTAPTGAVGNGEIEDYVVTITAAPLGVGNLVWLDANDNGRFDVGEGVSGVTVQLLNTSNTVVASTTTDLLGIYHLTTTTPATYYLKIPSSEFASGKPLNGKFSMLGSGNDNARDDDLDEDGIDDAAPGTNGIKTGNFVLGVGTEPTDAQETGQDSAWDDGTSGKPVDADCDLTKDFGFTGCSQVNVLANGSFETANPTTLTFTNRFPNPTTDSIISYNSYTAWFDKVASWGIDAGAYINDNTHATEGNRFIYYANSSVCIAQFVNVSATTSTGNFVPGGAYTLSFDWCPFDYTQPNGNASTYAGVNVELYYIDPTGVKADSQIATIEQFYDPATNDLTVNPRPLASWNNLTWRKARAQVILPPLPAGRSQLRLFITSASNGTILLDNVAMTPTCTPQMCSVGNVVFRDTNSNGIKDASESGIDGVYLSIYKRLANGSDVEVQTTVTHDGGQYFFSGLIPGNYFIYVDSGNFASSGAWWTTNGVGPLNGLISSPGNYDPTVPASSAVDDGDKGIDDASPSVNGISTPIFGLAVGAEPTTGSGGTENGVFMDLDSVADSNGDMTIDLGFRTSGGLDFGDLADNSSATGAGNYQTLLANNGPRHTIVAGLKLGSLVDSESDGAQSTNADGDGSDDDGLISLPTLTASLASPTFNVAVTNTTGSAAKLSVWIDFNNNGSFEDAGEKVAADINVANGVASVTVPSFSVPLTAYVAGKVGMRLRLSATAALTSLGAASSGEVEDYLILVGSAFDYGDWNGSGAATSSIYSIASVNLRLGGTVDTEGVVTQNASATGDDVTGTDDEDGVTMPASIIPGSSVTIPVSVFNNSGANAYLNAWIDLNNDGAFNDALVSSGGERLEAVRTISTNATVQTANITFTVPASASVGTQRGARFRLTNQATTLPTGASGTGEVEDYVVTIACPSLTITPIALPDTVVGVPYSQSTAFSVSGGLAPYSFGVPTGIPAGMTWDSVNNKLTGSATNAGVASVVVSVTDANGCSAQTGTISFRVCPMMTLSPSIMPDGFVSNSYAQVVSLDVGTGPFLWSISAGSLPAGLSMSSSTTTSVTISGTPTTVGTYAFTLRVVDSLGCSSSRSYTMAVRSLKVGNLVWSDTNNNGQRDAGENGISGLTVELWSAGTNGVEENGAGDDFKVMADVTTNASGNYSFINVLQGSNYYVRLPSPPLTNGISSGSPVTVDNGVDNDNNGRQSAPTKPLRSPLFSLIGGTEPGTAVDGDDTDGDQTIDFGLAPTVCVGNLVFKDVDHNGFYNSAADTVVSGVSLSIFAAGSDPLSATPVDTATTSASGLYRFCVLPGSYFVHVPPSQFAPGAVLDGTAPSLTALGNGDDDTDQNLVPSAKAYALGVNTNTFVLSVGGAPTGTAESGVQGASDDGYDANSDLTIDLGFYALPGPGAPLAGSVRRDLSGLGVVTASSTPLPGVEVVLYPDANANGTLDASEMVPIAETVTDNAGSFVFDPVPLGNYFAIQSLLPGARATGAVSDPSCLGVVSSTGPSPAIAFLQQLPPRTFREWQDQHAALGATDPHSDPDHDGYDNLMAYALSMPSSGGADDRHLKVAFGADGRLEASIITTSAGQPDIHYDVLTSQDLISWTSAHLVPRVVQNGNGTQTAVYSTSNAPFLRLQVTLDADQNGVPESVSLSPIFGGITRQFPLAVQSFSMPLLKPACFAGTFANATRDALKLRKACYLEVTGGSHEGLSWEVDSAASTDQGVVLRGDVPSDLASAPVAIREHWTISELFPASFCNAGAWAWSGDRVMFFDTTAQRYKVYWLLAASEGARWVRDGDAALADAGDTVVGPAEALMVLPKTAPVTLRWAGEVRSWKYVQPLVKGFQLLGSIYPVPMSPAERSMNSAAGFVAGQDISTSDFLDQWDADRIAGAVTRTRYIYMHGADAVDRWQDKHGGNSTDSKLFSPFGAVLYTGTRRNAAWIQTPPWNR